jgi:hypothetical protein
MKTILKSVIIGNSLLGLVLLVCAAMTARADTIDGSSVACVNDTCSLYSSGFGPGSLGTGIFAYCLDSNNQHSGTLNSAALVGGYISGIYYFGSVSASWSTSQVYVTGIIYDEETYNQSYVAVGAGCDGSSSGYLEDPEYFGDFWLDTVANGDGEYGPIL